MSDLISREAFYKELSKNSVKSNLTEDDFDYICHLLFIQPTIDAEPVRHGHWIWVKDHWECSVCRGNRFQDLILGLDAEYCGRCGAKMDEGTAELSL